MPNTKIAKPPRKPKQFIHVFTFASMEQNPDRSRKVFTKSLKKASDELRETFLEYRKVQREIKKNRRELGYTEMNLRTVHESIKETQYVLNNSEDILEQFSLLKVSDPPPSDNETVPAVTNQLEEWRNKVQECEWYQEDQKVKNALKNSEKEILQKRQELRVLEAKAAVYERLKEMELENGTPDMVREMIKQCFRSAISNQTASQEDIFDEEKSEEEA